MRKISVLCALMLTCALLSSCTEKNGKSAYFLLSEIMATADGLPAGIIYRSDASVGQESYFSPSAAMSMYGEEGARAIAETEEFALYVSSVGIPFEIAVFKCMTVSSADEIAAICLMRAEALRTLLHSTEWHSLAESARVERKGKTVIMTVTGEL